VRDGTADVWRRRMPVSLTVGKRRIMGVCGARRRGTREEDRHKAQGTRIGTGKQAFLQMLPFVPLRNSPDEKRQPVARRRGHTNYWHSLGTESGAFVCQCSFPFLFLSFLCLVFFSVVFFAVPETTPYMSASCIRHGPKATLQSHGNTQYIQRLPGASPNSDSLPPAAVVLRRSAPSASCRLHTYSNTAAAPHTLSSPNPYPSPQCSPSLSPSSSAPMQGSGRISPCCLHKRVLSSFSCTVSALQGTPRQSANHPTINSSEQNKVHTYTTAQVSEPNTPLSQV
jgi:hypothetical protein